MVRSSCQLATKLEIFRIGTGVIGGEGGLLCKDAGSGDFHACSPGSTDVLERVGNEIVINQVPEIVAKTGCVQDDDAIQEGLLHPDVPTSAPLWQECRVTAGEKILGQCGSSKASANTTVELTSRSRG